MIRPLQERDFWLIDSLSVPSSVHDLSGRFVYMNAAAEQASGFTNEQLCGRELTDRLPSETREPVRALFRRAVEHGEPTDFETIFVDGHGDRRGARVQQLPLRDGEEIVGVITLAFGVRTLPSGPIGLQPRPQLTPRQHEVLELIAAGHSTDEIARGLTLSNETVRNHLRNLFTELHVHTRVEAIATAQRLGLLALPVLGPQPDV